VIDLQRADTVVFKSLLRVMSVDRATGTVLVRADTKDGQSDTFREWEFRIPAALLRHATEEEIAGGG